MQKPHEEEPRHFYGVDDLSDPELVIVKEKKRSGDLYLQAELGTTSSKEDDEQTIEVEGEEEESLGLGTSDDEESDEELGIRDALDYGAKGIVNGMHFLWQQGSRLYRSAVSTLQDHETIEEQVPEVSDHATTQEQEGSKPKSPKHLVN